MVDVTPAWSLPETSMDNLEERFKKYEKSDNYNSRLIWDEDCVKIVLSAKYPLLRAFANLLVGVICIIITVTISWPESGIAAFFGFVFFMIGLAGLRGNQTLLIHENHLEIRFDRMNSGSTEVENPDCNSTEIKREDITAIKYCAATIAHTRENHNADIHGGPTTITTYEKISATRIFLALTDEMKEYGMDDDENPWFDIKSKTKIEAEELAEALNFLIRLNSD
ncbi:hypothetical protein OAM96_05225 [Candidatus Poseidoniaceae archaeon]|nr:hypothetical protein [Candidatus Poseidoniaceae archaeon]